MEKTRTLLIGASGLVGNEIFKCISKENQDIFLLSRRTSDKDQNKFKEIITELTLVALDPNIAPDHRF